MEARYYYKFDITFTISNIGNDNTGDQKYNLMFPCQFYWHNYTFCTWSIIIIANNITDTTPTDNKKNGKDSPRYLLQP